MKNYFIRLSNQHEIISKFILIFVTIFLIVLSLPKETQFNYTFQNDFVLIRKTNKVTLHSATKLVKIVSCLFLLVIGNLLLVNDKS